MYVGRVRVGVVGLGRGTGMCVCSPASRGNSRIQVTERLSCALYMKEDFVQGS